MHLEIVTPEAKTFEGEVEQVVLPGSEGEFGVLPGHEPFITQILPGELVVTQKDKQLFLAVGEGFVRVTPEGVQVLTDMAIRAEEIDEKQVEEARRRAEEALKGHLTDDENAAVMAAMQRSLAQLNVKRRRNR